jgi:hypothetical protein
MDVTNEHSHLNFEVTFYALFVSTKCVNLEKGVEKCKVVFNDIRDISVSFLICCCSLYETTGTNS